MSKMDEHAFQTHIHGLLGDVDPAATQSWLNYAKELELDGTESSDLFFREICGELELIQHEYGKEIAVQLYNEGRGYTFNPFELRTAAEHLKDGKPIQEVIRLSQEGDFFTLPRKYYKPETTITLPYEERWYEALRMELGEDDILDHLSAALDKMAMNLLPEGLFQKVSGEMEEERRFRMKVARAADPAGLGRADKKKRENSHER